MATVADFRVQFPEFKGTDDAQIGAMLLAAQLEIDTCVWGQYGSGNKLTKADQGQMYLAAHKLCISPFGQGAKLVLRPQAPFEKNQHPWSRTTYGNEFFLLMRGVSAGGRVC